MAWKESSVLEQRKLLIRDYLSDMFSITDLCEMYEISRPTAYLWIERFYEDGEEGLENLSKVPLIQPKTTPESIEKEIIHLKSIKGTWGAKKIKSHLERHKPELRLPSKTTIGKILKKHGLVKTKKVRNRFAERSEPLALAKGANDVWSADFKGGFITKDNHKCEPFTLTDNATRYLIKCVSLDFNNTDHVWAILDIAFREYGLPLYLRTDNGPPFASKGIGRLSSLAVKLIKAGVMPDFIDPGKPEQNGRHERMHGTLKAEAVFPELCLEAQKMKLHEFQNYYNFERPHEGINQETPGNIYTPSDRVWNGRFRSIEYPKSYKKAKVRCSGQIKLHGKNIYIGTALVNEYLGLEEVERGFKLYYDAIYLGDISENNELIIPRRAGRIRNKNFNQDFY